MSESCMTEPKLYPDLSNYNSSSKTKDDYKESQSSDESEDEPDLTEEFPVFNPLDHEIVYKIALTMMILLASASGVYWYCQPPPPSPPSAFTIISQQLQITSTRQYLRQFPSSWTVLCSALRTHSHAKVRVILVTHHSNESAHHTDTAEDDAMLLPAPLVAKCLLSDLSQHIFMNPNVRNIFSPEHSTGQCKEIQLKGNNRDDLKLFLDKSLSALYAEGLRCVILSDIHNYEELLLLFLHAIADPDTSPYKGMILFLTAQLHDSTSLTWLKEVESGLKELSQKEIDRVIWNSLKAQFLENGIHPDRVNSLLARISYFNIFIRSDSTSTMTNAQCH